MGFGFNRKKKGKGTSEVAAADMLATTDKDGNVEIVSKNFKMKATQKPAIGTDSTGETWICWGCGQPTSQDVCPVCGKKKTK